MDLVPYIYHEKQESGSMLCGQHALNNLLQSQLFTPQDLADIARQLDAMEAAQLDPGTRLGGERGSENYDDSGFFSVQVMERALEVLGLRLVRWGSKEMEHMHSRPELIEAFLLNHQLHWFTIRRFGPSPDRFYNLDSCVPAPQWVGSMYLGLTLKEAEQQGYSIFAILPAADAAVSGLPPCEASDKALNLPPPHGGGAHASTSSGSGANGYSSFSGNGYSIKGASASSSSFGPASASPFSSALNPSLAAPSSSSARKGKRPVSDDDSDDSIIIEDPALASTSSSSDGRRQRRKLAGEMGQNGGGDAYEEEMMARAMKESLKPSRAALSEEAEFERAIAASLAQSSDADAEVDEDDHVQDDAPTMEQLRAMRLARFGG
ncbi:hypothetical protein JCM10213v2_004676 [Rhodosporidiobolus nylandii]